MKKLFLLILVLLALFTSVACLDVTPYPLLDTDAGAEPIEGDAGADGG